MSHHRRTDLHSSQHQPSCSITLQTWDKMQNSSAHSLYMGDFKEHLATYYYISRFCHLSILLSWLWKKENYCNFSAKNSAFESMLFMCTCIHTFFERERNIQEHEENCDGKQLQICPNKAYLLCDVWMLFAFQWTQQHCKPKFFSLLHHLENCSFWLLNQACVYILSVYFVSSTVTLALWYTEVLPTQFLTHLSCSFSALIPGE